MELHHRSRHGHGHQNHDRALWEDGLRAGVPDVVLAPLEVVRQAHVCLVRVDLQLEGEEVVVGEKYEYENVTERGTSTLYIVEENKTSSI